MKKLLRFNCETWDVIWLGENEKNVDQTLNGKMYKKFQQIHKFQCTKMLKYIRLITWEVTDTPATRRQ
jgi:hypothetical protein